MTDNSILDQELYELLCELRNQIAKQKNLPPFIIFHNGTLKEMAETKPETIDEVKMLTYSSVNKARKYGRPFLVLISDWKKSN